MPMPDQPRYRYHQGPGTESSEVKGRYFCDACNQEIFVLLDVSAGRHQDFVEECPVCGCPMMLHADIDQNGRTRVDGEREP
jgi:hypothetical protein